MIVTSVFLVSLAMLCIADNCGYPTPAITLVVHIDPGPIPTFIQSAPAPINDFDASLVATFPATT